MKFDLREIQTYWINLEDDKVNAKRMTEMCDSLGLNHRRMRGIKRSPGIVGCGLSHLACWWHIGGQDRRLPALVFEDDATQINHEDFNPIIDVPDECSALYLGVSSVGMNTGGGANSVRATRYNKDYIQLHNMLSLHACVFLNPEYLIKLVNMADELVCDKQVPIDVVSAMMHKDFLVLTPNRPWFYQSDPEKKAKFDVEFYTKNPIVPEQLPAPPPEMVYGPVRDSMGRFVPEVRR